MTDKEKLKEITKLADAMYYAAFNLTTDASRLKKAMNEYRQFIINEYGMEETVSEDLEEAANKYIKGNYSPWLYKAMFGCFKAGAQWQKEQMMADAIECKVYWYDGFLLDYTQEQQDELLEKIGADVGDKVKVIVIKED